MDRLVCRELTSLRYHIDKDPFYAYFSVVVAAFFALIMGVAVIVLARRDRNFMRSRYWKWLAGVAALSIGLPLGSFLLGSPLGPRSLADSYLLQGWYPGWNRVVDAYAMLSGVLVGGVVAILFQKA